MENNFEICSFFNKRCYTHDKALGALKNAKRTHNNSTIPTRMYHCGSCGYWHLTCHQNYSDKKKKPLKTLNDIKEDFDLSEVFNGR